MNWKIFQWWASQTPTNKLITGLGIALVALSTSLATMFGILNSDKNALIESLNKKVESRDSIISRKDDEIAKCREESNKRAYELVEYERDKSRVADSMYYALTAAREAVKKAKRNANK